MNKNIVISLCDYTGIFTRPWAENGYEVIHVDPQRDNNGTILEMIEVVGEAIRSGRVAFVAGFPPCTDVAVSGARWWKDKRAKDPYFQAKATAVAEQCRMIGMLSGAPWFFENPVSAFSKIFGKPNYTFHPYEYQNYYPGDNYTKKTCIWSGGGFIMPETSFDPHIEVDDRIHKCPPSDQRANTRSQTPIGFSLAVFESNKQIKKGEQHEKQVH